MKSFLVLLVSLFAFTGCATITRGTTEPVSVSTAPAGASVTTNSGIGCASTPCTLELARAHDVELTVRKSGCRTQKVTLRSVRSVEGDTALVGNAIFGGIIGVAVDNGNGALKDLKPNPVQVNLSC